MHPSIISCSLLVGMGSRAHVFGNPPVGIRGRGALPLPEDTEEVEDPLTDMLSKSAMDPGPDPGGGGGDGSGGLHAAITGAAARSTGAAIGTGVGMVVPAMLTCATGATA